MKSLERVIDTVTARGTREPEFGRVAAKVLRFLDPVAEKHPAWLRNNLFETFLEPERQIMFRVPWVDDTGNVQVHRGFRVQFNSAIGPYNGGVRFDPSVNIDALKALAFEQALKNALTGYPLGGARGGSDFNPADKSDGEIMRFCQSFMSELHRHIGKDTDVLTPDAGVGQRELCFLDGQYRRLKNDFGGAVTGSGGFPMSTKATGYGVGYFVEAAVKSAGKTCKDATVVVSGSGNNAVYVTKKMEHLGARVVTLSDADGYLHDPDGIKRTTVKNLEGAPMREYVKHHPNAKYIEGRAGIWSVTCDIAFACAGRNEIDGPTARMLVSRGCFAVGEAADDASSPEAKEVFADSRIIHAPSMPANVGSAILSALEMSQMSERTPWTFEEVDARIRDTMVNLYKNAGDAAKEYGFDGNLEAGAIIVAFSKIAEAMCAQGLAG